MKKILIALVVTLSLVSNLCFGDCNWSTGITPGPNSTYIYSEACHLAVGKLVQDQKIKDQQIQDYQKAIQLKDLALSTSDSRVTLWMDTSAKLETRLSTIDKLEKSNQYIYYGLGVLTMLGAGWMASKMIKP